jgi:hypothetical protein
MRHVSGVSAVATPTSASTDSVDKHWNQMRYCFPRSKLISGAQRAVRKKYTIRRYGQSVSYATSKQRLQATRNLPLASLTGCSKQQYQINAASLANIPGNWLGLQGDTCGYLLAEYVKKRKVCLENLIYAQLNSMPFRKIDQPRGLVVRASDY